MKPNQQERKSDQVETVTGKSSGLNYVSSTMNPSQKEAESRMASTKNDGSKKAGG
jgi:hypothetical protein